MKNKILLFLLTSTLIGCTVNEKPEFIKIENIVVLKATPSEILLNADAIFNNPNHIGGTLESDGINVFINGIEVANVTSEPFKVLAKDNFSIPLEVTIPTKKVLNTNNIGGLLNSLFSEKINVQYKGILKYNLAGFSYNYEIDETQDINIKFKN